MHNEPLAYGELIEVIAKLASPAGFSGVRPFFKGADKSKKWLSSFPDGDKKCLLPN